MFLFLPRWKLKIPHSMRAYWIYLCLEAKISCVDCNCLARREDTKIFQWFNASTIRQKTIFLMIFGTKSKKKMRKSFDFESFDGFNDFLYQKIVKILQFSFLQRNTLCNWVIDTTPEAMIITGWRAAQSIQCVQLFYSLFKFKKKIKMMRKIKRDIFKWIEKISFFFHRECIPMKEHF